MKNLSTCQEIMIIQQEIYYFICVIKMIINIALNTSILQQINFVRELAADGSATMFAIAGKQK